MEGAVLSGKLAAEVNCDKASDRSTTGVRVVNESAIHHAIKGKEPRRPVGVRGDYPIAFGGGQQGTGGNVAHP
jgi:hypothetical protein